MTDEQIKQLENLDNNERELIDIYRKLTTLYKEYMIIKGLMILNEQKLCDPLEHIKSYNKWNKLNSVNNIYLQK